MVQFTTRKGHYRVSAPAYTLVWATDRPYVYLADARGHRYAELFVLSSVHTLDGLDDTVKIGPWQVALTGDEVILSLTASSSLWERKTYRFRCSDTRFRYEVEVEGTGRLTDVRYFGGYYSGQMRWGPGYQTSGQKFRRIFNPEPTMAETYRLPSCASATIDLVGVPLPGKGGWFFTPPPFCFAAQLGHRWMAMGVEAAPGRNTFTEYRYHGQLESFDLSLSYEGYTAVDGTYALPAIGFDFADDEYGALGKHADALRAAGHAAKVDAEPARWWHEPIFCGWGTQCYEASKGAGRAPDLAVQKLYDTSLGTLRARGVEPGIVVLDDKWQEAYGSNRADALKWPDLRRFVGGQHADGRKVLLWLKAWDPEGVPVEECVTNAAGMPIGVDPSNPAYEARLRESVRLMLAPEGYDADGFKIDFTARIPVGPGARAYGDLWGLELMRRYLWIIHDEAKRAKPDALVMAHTPHPYLADVVDMIRLNDINVEKDVPAQMTHRARVAAAACPNAIIDTDNWPIPNRATWREYVAMQPTLGVPSLYYATHVDMSGEALQDEDYALIRERWAAHRARQAAPASELRAV